MTLLRIHVIRVETPEMTITCMTKPTTLPVEYLEMYALRQHPNGTLKRTWSFLPEQYEALDAEADNLCISIDELLDWREKRTVQGEATPDA